MGIYKKQVSGAADAEVLVKSNEWTTPSSWSPDGRFLLYVSEGGKTSGDLWVLPLEGHKKPVPFLRTEFDERQGRFSPDGRWVSYVSNESGRSEVYVRPFSPDALGEGISSAGGKRLISESGGWDPFWRQDGKELYFIDLDGSLMAVKLTTGSVFQVGVPRVLFQAPPPGTGDLGLPRWQPSPDGKRFLFLVPETPARGAIHGCPQLASGAEEMTMQRCGADGSVVEEDFVASEQKVVAQLVPVGGVGGVGQRRCASGVLGGDRTRNPRRGQRRGGDRL